MAKRKLKARRRPAQKRGSAKRLKAKRRNRKRKVSAAGLRLPAEILVERILDGVIVSAKRTDTNDPHALLMSFTIKGASVRSEDRAIIVYGEFKKELRRVLRKHAKS